MAYDNFMNSTHIPNEFGEFHKEFANIIIYTLTFNLDLDIDHNDHPFKKFATNDRNQNVRNIEDITKNNNEFGEQILVDYFRSNSIYHDWLQTILDFYEDYADERGFEND